MSWALHMGISIFSGYGPDKLRKSSGYSLVFNLLPLFCMSLKYLKETSVRNRADKNTEKQTDRQTEWQTIK